MNKQQFQAKIKVLKGLGITQKQIAKKIGYSVASIERAKSDKWLGDCTKVYNAFKNVFR
jgi:transcriptional regulator with XRE-family HTH domain